MTPAKQPFLALFVAAVCCGPVAAYGNTDSLNRIESVKAIASFYKMYRSAAQSGTVDSAALRSRFEPSVLPLLTEEVSGLFVTGRGVMGYGVSTGAAGGMSIRGIGGAPTSGVLVMIDGMPQYMGLMGHPLADTYLADNAESVNVVRGPASALHGSNAMGGIINITTRQPQGDGASTSARLMYGSHNTASGSIGTAFRKKRFRSSVSLNHNRSDGHRPDMEYRETGGSARLGYQISGAWQARAGIDITRSLSSNPGSATDPLIDNDADITRGTAYLLVENNYGKTHGAVDVYYNFGRHDINDGYKPSQADAPPLQWFHSRDWMSGASLSQSVNFTRIRSMLSVGADFRYFGGRSYNEVGVTRSNENDRSLYDAAVYVNYNQLIGRKIYLNAAVRADYHEVAGWEWVPQAGIIFNPENSANRNKAISLKASVAKGFRNPTIRELYMFPPSNAGLKAERIMNYDIGIEFKPRRIPLRAELVVFFVDGSNMVQTIVSEGRPKWVNSGKVRNYGVEFSGSYRIIDRLSVAANYTWLAMEHKVTGAPEHKLYVSATYGRPKWGVQSGVQYINNLYTRITPEPETQSYTLWNLRTWWNISRSVRLFVRAENLLNRGYETMLGYPMPGTTVFGGIDLNF